nr:MAG TPA: hypothetical protein [Caudoviricetes sp.]
MVLIFIPELARKVAKTEELVDFTIIQKELESRGKRVAKSVSVE